MTMRYAHVDDREIQAAAEREGQVIEAMMASDESISRKAPVPRIYPIQAP